MMKRKIGKIKINVLVVVLILVTIVLFIVRANAIVKLLKIPSSGTSQYSQATSTPVLIDPKIKRFGLQIDKLGIIVPVVQDVDGKNKAEYNQSLQEGVAHYKGTALPGEGKNVFIFGHSSSDTVPGELGKIFAKINDLEKGDKLKIYFREKEFLYDFSEKYIVEKTDDSVLNKTDQETLTLMTCWPLGTTDKRLIIRAVRQ